MKKVAIIHNMPLEYYPPTINQLNILGDSKVLNIRVWTSSNDRLNSYENDKISQIVRFPFTTIKDSKLRRVFKYLHFNLMTLFGLIVFNPDRVYYFESYSAWPVYWYSKLINKKVLISKHCHEYFDPEWYKQGMRLVRKNYQYEKSYLYPKADWISHTNTDRISLFLKDHSNVSPVIVKHLPNYPPKSWAEVSIKKDSPKTPLTREKEKIKLVYIGSVSLVDTYLEKLCEFVSLNSDRISLDIYSYNYHEDAKTYLSRFTHDAIKFFDNGIQYNLIPKTLIEYDIGIIMYKVNTLNCDYCAPNKLFEYLSCGLDVWVSKEQTGCQPYLQTESQPFVKAIDYNKLSPDLILDYYNLLSKDLPVVEPDFYYESVIDELLNHLEM